MMPLVPMHAVWPWHWRGGAGQGLRVVLGRFRLQPPFSSKRNMKKYTAIASDFFYTGVKTYS